ncbi:hypothetical protein SPI_03957 [Niveomyces insectorum RCEF 264]|uniref:Cell surface protein n=1 Tax=Niveomyces insectorum RCEF 264 TaxID=1081102 RepID=A0A167VB00_9HYPO|nr:hypothetical protein SPI_03957 [Niveomyces insectorum RCEF 264]
MSSIVNKIKDAVNPEKAHGGDAQHGNTGSTGSNTGTGDDYSSGAYGSSRTGAGRQNVGPQGGSSGLAGSGIRAEDAGMPQQQQKQGRTGRSGAGAGAGSTGDDYTYGGTSAPGSDLNDPYSTGGGGGGGAQSARTTGQSGFDPTYGSSGRTAGTQGGVGGGGGGGGGYDPTYSGGSGSRGAGSYHGGEAGPGTTTGAATGIGGGAAGAGGYSGTGRASSGTTGPASNTAGPHSSDWMNKVDPRVDSDLDGSQRVGGNPLAGGRGGSGGNYPSTYDSMRDPKDAAQVPPSVMAEHLGDPSAEYNNALYDRARRNSSATHQESFRGI